MTLASDRRDHRGDKLGPSPSPEAIVVPGASSAVAFDPITPEHGVAADAAVEMPALWKP